MKIFKILDKGEGKAAIVNIVDMTHHDLRDEIDGLKQRPWSSITISDRMISFG